MASATITIIRADTITTMAVIKDKPVGTFYGIGVGPGDPEFLTLKAARILKEVDWVFAPAHAEGKSGFAETIVAPLRIDGARLRRVRLCMQRERDSDIRAYDQAAKEIVGALRLGQSAAWITEGDPLFFSTFAHVLNAVRRLDANLPIEIVPGVTSINAAAARILLPVAQLDECVAVVPATYGLDHLMELLERFAAVFLLKVGAVFDNLLDELAALPILVDAWYVEKVGTAQEQVVHNLTSLRGRKLPYFSLVMLRRVKGSHSI